MSNENSPSNYEEIQHDLRRTAIKQPLLSMVLDPQRNKDEKIPVIVEVNDGYYDGKAAAVQIVTSLVRSLAGVDLPSIGSDMNPFYKTELMSHQILDIVDKDDNDAQARDAAARAHQAEDKSAARPLGLARYLTILRIWYNHRINPLIDKSVSTVKADAALRSFLAEGKGIVWAVIDSGIDQNHQHFGVKENLKVTAPIQHCDFTIPNGVNSPTALVDNFGHGTHVAGIIAGAYASDAGKPKAKARRSKLVRGSQVDTFEEELSQIAGMAPSCTLVSLKVLDDQGNGEVSNIIDAIDRIQVINDFGRSLNIHGVNLSVGYEFDPTWFACGQSPVCVEVNRLVRSGVVVVVAAGNTGYGVLSANQRTTGAGFMLTINDPGNAELAITVGSTHRDAPHTYGVSYFSSKGPTGDGRMKPDLVAPGERILSCCSSTKDASHATTVYIEDSGTSMAAPHVSGVIAAFLSIRREYIGEPERVKQLFLSTATDLGRNSYFQGRGLIDLMRAIQSM
jgi:serine protease AprX